MNPGSYEDLLHRLERVRSGDTDRYTAAAERLRQTEERVTELRGKVAQELDDINDTTALLHSPVLDLRAPAEPGPAADGTAAPVPVTLDEDLRAAHAALGRAAAHRKAAVQAGQLPAFLPKGHHLLRNALVYLAAMAVTLVVQLLAAQFPGTDDYGMWIAFILPVVGLIAGYVATGVAARPRIATMDKHGKPITLPVYRSPRLGATFAVLTIVLYFLLIADL